MNQNLRYITILGVCLFFSNLSKANLINATPANYIGFLSTLTAGDTLKLASGNYTSNLTLNGINGTNTKPIVILGSGNSTNFQGQSCCNTVSITQCSYVVIKKLQLDGLNLAIDAVKGEGTTGNWAHHITLEYLNIINYGSSQQNVGISTKCPAWNWVIRKNRIIGAGTGMYLGNSDGTKPFVNGVIEYNYVANTVGYNIEIKHQINGQRELMTGTSVNGKTILRYNVFTKDESSSTGGNARPNLLVGGFPTLGYGEVDYYEIYGNFFYNNPVEALFQGTGNIMLYNNIFVNHFDPSGYRAVYITPQNGVSPQDIKVFHNTVWVANSSGAIRLYTPNTAYKQYCYGNAVFAAAPITNFTDTMHNVTGSYSNATNFVSSATTAISTLNLYPKTGQLTGALTPSNLLANHTNWFYDFNQDTYNWMYRGAYSGNGINKGWKLQLDTMATPAVLISVHSVFKTNDFEIFPNPVHTMLTIIQNNFTPSQIEIITPTGEKIYSTLLNSSPSVIDFTDKPNGVYFIFIKNESQSVVKKIIKN